ncbi:hypothetical protein Chor_008055 [Crotalus horridus]
MRNSQRPKLRFSSLQLLLLLLLLWAARRPCAAGDEEEEEEEEEKKEDADMPEWGSMFPHCEGHMQSPININTTAVSFSAKLGPLLLSGYNVPPEVKLPLKNNGHTGLPKKMTLGGGGFPQPYQAAQLHLHWGSGLTRPGSEHTVDGHRYADASGYPDGPMKYGLLCVIKLQKHLGGGDQHRCFLSVLSAVLCVCLQIHVVHYSSHFESIQEAASEPGGLAVLAAFLQVGVETNEPYQHILKHLSEIKEEVAGFDVAKLLPDDFGRYFRYNGSLTTPPCYQTVNWTVFNQTVRLSQKQISMLEDTLRGDEDEPIQSNFRHLQDLYGRSIFSSFHSLEKVQPTDGAPRDRLDPLDSGKDGAPRDLDPPDSGKDGIPRDGLDPPDSGKDGSPRDGLHPPDSGKDGAPRDGLDPPDSGKDGAPRDGLDPPDSGKDAEKQVDTSLHTGDILAILFGSLFVATALAFLFYIHKHRRLASRHRGQATKPAALYVLASTDEQAL